MERLLRWLHASVFGTCVKGCGSRTGVPAGQKPLYALDFSGEPHPGRSFISYWDGAAVAKTTREAKNAMNLNMTNEKKKIFHFYKYVATRYDN